jgi:hypothetical protein
MRQFRMFNSQSSSQHVFLKTILTSLPVQQGRKNSGSQGARITKFLTVGPKIFSPEFGTWLHVTLLAPGILMCLPDFCENYGPLHCTLTHLPYNK